MICSAPCPMVAAVPSVVGTLPTSTNPPLSTPSAVLKPCSPLVKNVAAVPGGAITPVGLNWLMVVPVPWMLALLLKLAISTSPDAMSPPVGKPSGTNATPYGLTSPFDGTVDELIRSGMNASCACAVCAAPESPTLAANKIMESERPGSRAPRSDCRITMNRPLVLIWWSPRETPVTSLRGLS
jgi:hypothetical protein